MAANYDQPPYVEKRVRFFDGQYLQDQDFVDEQKFHVDRQRRHNRTLHIAGIADGLRVSKATDAPARMTVAAGTAVDSDGRPLVLAKNETVDLPGSQLANKTVNLYLVYREQPADLQTQAGSKDHSRWLEQPEIKAVTKGEAPGGNYPPVLLAELTLDGSGSITAVNSNVRQYSGLRLPGPNADGPTLRTDANGLVRLDGGLTVTGKVGIGTTDPKATLHVNGELRSDGARTIINGFDGALNHWIKTNAAEPGSVFMAFSGTADGKSQAVHIAPGNSNGLRVNSDGNVGIGIGTTSPGAKLDVSGVGDTAGQVSLQLRSGNSSANYNSNQIALGYSNTAQYRHAIKTRHHNGQTAGNAIDFYVWKYGADTADAVGSLHTLTLDGGNVGIGTTTPDSKLTITAIQQSAESGITQTVANNGLNIEANYLADSYLPGIVWTTNDNNPTKPKAGIWISEHATGSRLYLGTSDNYSTGITNKAITIHESGNVGIGAPTPKGFQITLPESSKGGNAPGAGVTIAGGDSASIELRGSGTPYIDFAKDASTTDFHARIRLTATDKLAIEGANVGIGTVDPGYKLTVSASQSLLQLRRESTETTGGKKLFLELYQNDPSSRVPQVYPSIRFHHNNKFWHRLEAQSDGFHMKDGNLDGDGYVPLKVGDLRVNGQFVVAGGQAVTGIPVIEFRSLQQKFSGHSASAKMLTYTFTFSRPVVSAVPMLSTWFLRYANREFVKEAGVGCYTTRISGNTVAVDVYFFLKDATGNYDDPYEGEAIVVVIAQLSQAV